MPDSNSSLWVDYRRPTFEERKNKWEKAWDFYSGEVLDHPEEYIYRREQGETKEAWEERAALADFGGHIANLADSFIGMAFQSGEEETMRTWQGEDQAEGFGDPSDQGSVAHRLRNDIDGDGTDLEAFWKEVASYLIVLHECWILAEGPLTDEDEQGREETVEESRLQLLKPWEVVNTYSENGSLQQVLVKGSKDERGSIRDVPNSRVQYTLYEPAGWRRFEVRTAGDEDSGQRRVEQVEAAAYDDGDPFINRAGQEVPPIIKAELPLKRFLGWLAANKEQAIFNKESERDFAARMSSFGKLVPTDEHLSDEEWAMLRDKLVDGSTLLQFAMDYIHPSSEPVQANGQILDEKIQNFYQVMFQRYEDEAKQATATEIRQDAYAGQDAFLNLLVGGLDEAEMGAMWLMGQIEFPGGGEEVWGGFQVSRPRQFDPTDPQEAAQQIRDRYFGRKPVPIGNTGKTDAALTIAEIDGIDVDPDEVEGQVELTEARNEAMEAAGRTFGVDV